MYVSKLCLSDRKSVARVSHLSMEVVSSGQYWVISNYEYNHKSRTQDAPALRTGDGGLKIFDDRSTLPTHPVPKLSFIMTTVCGGGGRSVHCV